MKNTVKTAAYGLLSSLSRAEVAELIEVLSYYNGRCAEDQRAACLRLRCANKEQPLLEEKTAGSTDVYLTGNQSVCPCCRR